MRRFGEVRVQDAHFGGPRREFNQSGRIVDATGKVYQA